MHTFRGSVYFILLWLFAVNPVWTQDESNPEKLPETPEIKAFLDARARIDQLNKEIEEIFAKARTLTRSDQEELQKLQSLFNEKYKKQSTELSGLKTTGLSALKAAPTSKTIGETLLQIAIADIQGDKFREAYELLQTLLQQGNPADGINDAATMAAFALDDFTAALKHFQTATENKEVQRLSSRFTTETLKKHLVDWKQEQAIRTAEATKNDLPRVKLETTEGSLVIELFENEAPQAVGNFVNLVEKKYYDGLIFHRVLPGFMAQGGCPDGRGSGGPGYNIYCECQNDGYRKHFSGTLSMAHAGKDTGGSQFFLTFLPTPHLDGRHTAFGRVIEGMDVLSKLKRVNPQQPSGTAPSKIKQATVIRKRQHPYVPTKVK